MPRNPRLTELPLALNGQRYIENDADGWSIDRRSGRDGRRYVRAARPTVVANRSKQEEVRRQQQQLEAEQREFLERLQHADEEERQRQTGHNFIRECIVCEPY